MKLHGFEITVCKSVYEPAEDTAMLAEILIRDEYQQKMKNKIVVEIGTGCGLLAMICSKSAKQVIATDISRHAISCARKNAEKNKIKNISFVLCDLFSAFNKKLKADLIIFNPPYLPGFEIEINKKSEAYLKKEDASWYGGEKGIEVTQNFLKDAKNYLARSKESGMLLFLASSLSKHERLFSFMKKINLKFKIIAKQRLFFEELFVIEGKF